MNETVEAAQGMPIYGWVVLGLFFAFLAWKFFGPKKKGGGTGGSGRSDVGSDIKKN
jgi:hypothetical protein